MLVWQQPRNPPCACSKQPVVMEDRRRCGLPRNISIPKINQRSGERTIDAWHSWYCQRQKSGIHLAQQRTSQFYNQPTTQVVNQVLPTRSQFDLFRNPSNIASCLIGILRHREALCVWVLLLAGSWPANLPVSAYWHVCRSNDAALELILATKAWLATSSTDPFYCSVKFS